MAFTLLRCLARAYLYSTSSGDIGVQQRSLSRIGHRGRGAAATVHTGLAEGSSQFEQV